MLFWRKDFAATSMNDLCDALSVRSPDLNAAFGSKGGAPSRSRAQLQTIRPPVWGIFEGVTVAPALKTACGAKRGLFERRPKLFRGFPDALKIVSVNRRSNLALRIASSANVTLMAALQRSIRRRVIGRANGLSKLARWEGLWAGRALHSPSRP